MFEECLSLITQYCWIFIFIKCTCLVSNDLILLACQWPRANESDCGDLGMVEGVKEVDNLLESRPIFYSELLHVNYRTFFPFHAIKPYYATWHRKTSFTPITKHNITKIVNKCEKEIVVMLEGGIMTLIMYLLMSLIITLLLKLFLILWETQSSMSMSFIPLVASLTSHAFVVVSSSCA